VPKVIDFGIAKATNQRLTEKTLFTEYRQFIGTPQYMSPEQAEMSGLDVDTRADIYSLGVLLYELLTGTTPFDAGRLRSLAFSEIHRVIREEDPQKPSTRVSTLGDQATTAAKQRSTDIGTLRKALSGDLDWIAMKALEKDRTRRYDTANALIQDIRRHRENEPVSAGPPGAAYRTRKFLRRNRTTVAAGGAVAVALLAGLAVASYGFLEASRERAHAQRAAAAAQSVNAFFADMLASVNPMQLHLTSAFQVADLAPDVDATFAHDVSVAEMLQRSAKRVPDSFDSQPELEATMREILGTTLLGLDEFDDAAEQFRRSHELRVSVHGPEHFDALRTRVELAEALMWTTDLVGAEDSLESVVSDLQRLRGPEDPVTLYAEALWALLLTDKGGNMAQADSLFESVLERQERVLGENHRDTIRTLTASAHVHTWQGNGAEALKRSKKAHDRAIATYSPDDAVVLDNEMALGLSYAFLREYDKAKEILIPSLEKHRRVFGDNHAMTRYLAFSLARAHRDEDDDVEERIKYYRWAMGERGTDPVPITDGTRWVATRDVCNILVDAGRTGEALDILRPQIEMLMDPDSEALRSFWPEGTARILSNLMGPYRMALAEHPAELRELTRRRLGLRKEAADQDDASWDALNDYAYQVLTVEPADLRNPREGLAYARRAVEALGPEPGDGPGLVYDTLAKALELNGDVAGALREERRSLVAFVDGGRGRRRDVVYSATQAVRYASELEDPRAVRGLIDQALGAFEQWRADDPDEYAATLIHFADQLADRGLLAEAERPARRALEAAEDSGNDEWRCRAAAGLARVLGEKGEQVEAARLADEALDRYRAAWGTGAPPEDERDARNSRRALIPALLAAGRPRVAADLHDELSLGSHWYTPRVRSLTQEATVAEEAWRERVERCIRRGFDESAAWTLGCYEAGLARSLMELGRWDEARELLLKARLRLREWGGPASAHTRRVEARLAALERRELDPWAPGGW
ncbi:MAG TPA: tetratricopeptide repeat-containing protein kinase family protein, partial [bacterium]|nr:tetratricopeptide repeat-containing protein kinase family protein [bacterium]